MIFQVLPHLNFMSFAAYHGSVGWVGEGARKLHHSRIVEQKLREAGPPAWGQRARTLGQLEAPDHVTTAHCHVRGSFILPSQNNLTVLETNSRFLNDLLLFSMFYLSS